MVEEGVNTIEDQPWKRPPSLRSRLLRVTFLSSLGFGVVFFFLKITGALDDLADYRTVPDHKKFSPRRVVSEFPPIQDPVLIKGANSEGANSEDKIHPSELVLGIEIEGESRAYPINMLTGPHREIINDALGGRSIAATW